MGYLKIISLEYSGDNFFYQSPKFSDGVNIIEGVNGSGKTTFIHLIYFGLGGTVDEFIKEQNQLVEIYQDTNNFVVLEISINGIQYKLKRYFKMPTTIAVSNDEKQLLTFPIDRRNGIPFSDWLLEQLKIKVFTVYNGISDWYINFMDLIRLIYHDQDVYHGEILKAPDKKSNFLYNDSSLIKKAIFQILLGYSSATYYAENSIYRNLEKVRNKSKQTLEAYQEMITSIYENNEWINSNLGKLEERNNHYELLEKRLLEEIKEIKVIPQDQNMPDARIDATKKEIILAEQQSLVFYSKKSQLERDILEINALKFEIENEIKNLDKIIFTQQKLNLFQSNICPFCLKEYKKEPNKCICGNDRSEGDNQFFYLETSEYFDLQKAKKKSLKTIDDVLSSHSNLLESLIRDHGFNTERINILNKQLIDRINEKGTLYDNSSLVELSEKLAAVKNSVEKNNKELNFRKKFESLSKELDKANEKYAIQKIKVEQLANEMEKDLEKKRAQFSEIYNKYMKNVMDCKEASINEDYFPVVNGGVYIEDSAVVPIRLMYYFSMLKYSLINDSVVFPRLLLIDTPETAGIDSDNLNKNLYQMLDFDLYGKEYQVLLTTGFEKYPEQFKDKVVIRLQRNNRLLVEKK